MKNCAYCLQEIGPNEPALEVTSVRYAGSEDVVHESSDDCPELRAELLRARW